MGAEWPFSRPVAFLTREIRGERLRFIYTPDNVEQIPSNSFFSPRNDGVPHAYESVQASGDQQALPLAKVECLDAFMNSEDPLVARRPELWSPA